jgi:hypothetical protein
MSTPARQALKKKGREDLGAGLRVSKDNIAAHPAGPPRYGELTQAERAFTLASTFLSGVLAYASFIMLYSRSELIDSQYKRFAIFRSASEAH